MAVESQLPFSFFAGAGTSPSPRKQQHVRERKPRLRQTFQWVVVDGGSPADWLDHFARQHLASGCSSTVLDLNKMRPRLLRGPRPLPTAATRSGFDGAGIAAKGLCLKPSVSGSSSFFIGTGRGSFCLFWKTHWGHDSSLIH